MADCQWFFEEIVVFFFINIIKVLGGNWWVEFHTKMVGKHLWLLDARYWMLDKKGIRLRAHGMAQGLMHRA